MSLYLNKSSSIFICKSWPHPYPYLQSIPFYFRIFSGFHSWLKKVRQCGSIHLLQISRVHQLIKPHRLPWNAWNTYKLIEKKISSTLNGKLSIIDRIFHIDKLSAGHFFISYISGWFNFWWLPIPFSRGSLFFTLRT